jgi:hypothetical protein
MVDKSLHSIANRFGIILTADTRFILTADTRFILTADTRFILTADTRARFSFSSDRGPRRTVDARAGQHDSHAHTLCRPSNVEVSFIDYFWFMICICWHSHMFTDTLKGKLARRDSLAALSSVGRLRVLVEPLRVVLLPPSHGLGLAAVPLHVGVIG